MAVSAIGAVVAVGTTLYSQDRADARAEDVEKAQEKRSRKQEEIRSYKAASARRKKVQQAMIARARIENQAAATGASGSSAAIAGGQSAIQQAGAGIGDINKQLSQQSSLEAANMRVLRAQNQGPGLGEALASSVGSAFTGALVSKGAESLFDGQ